MMAFRLKVVQRQTFVIVTNHELAKTHHQFRKPNRNLNNFLFYVSIDGKSAFTNDVIDSFDVINENQD